jgi:hypothetical protein
MPCTFDDIKIVAGHTVHDVYTQGGQDFSSYNSFLGFQINMWNHYQGILPGPSGCAWWAARVTHWTNQLNPANWPPNLTNYQVQLKTAKIIFAQQMHIACGCPGPPPV